MAGLLLLGLLVLLGLWALRRRKQRKEMTEKRESAEPVTYAGLNSSFSGVPFEHGIQHTVVNAPLSHMRNGGLSPQDSAIETDRFLPPAYANSHDGTGARSLNRQDTNSESLTPLANNGQGLKANQEVSPISPGPLPRTDTMGFAISPPPQPQPGHGREATANAAIISPLPRRPTVDSPYLQAQQNPMEDGRTRSQQTRSVSPVSDIGEPGRVSPVSLLDVQGGGVNRNISQRTVSSIGSNYPGMVSDEDLERLGVGTPTVERPGWGAESSKSKGMG